MSIPLYLTDFKLINKVFTEVISRQLKAALIYSAMIFWLDTCLFCNHMPLIIPSWSLEGMQV